MKRRLGVGAIIFLVGLSSLCGGATNQEAKVVVKKPLDPLLLASNFWGLTRDALPEKGGGMGFHWVSSEHDVGRSAEPGMTFLDQPVVEALIRLGSNTVSEVELYLFNRGDAGDISADKFEAKVAAAEAALCALTGAKGKDVTSRDASTTEQKRQAIAWTEGPNAYRLDYACTWRKLPNSTRRLLQPEFLNLTILKNTGQTAWQLGGNERADVAYHELKKRVKRNASGDVWLDQIPMVDQGQKGYCAVATTERVMRYYGVEVNQHELAQKAATASAGGTDPESLVKALRSMAITLNVQIRVLMHYSFNDFTKFVQDYNRAARHDKKEEVILPESGVIMIDDVYGSMNKDLFVKVRTRNPALIAGFLQTVKEKTDDGYPVLWSVIIGFVPEKPELPANAHGGHLRLIIGYNSRTNELIYTDSWGAGHEMKRMNVSAAYAITTGLFSIEPM